MSNLSTQGAYTSQQPVVPTPVFIVPSVNLAKKEEIRTTLDKLSAKYEPDLFTDELKFIKKLDEIKEKISIEMQRVISREEALNIASKNPVKYFSEISLEKSLNAELQSTYLSFIERALVKKAEGSNSGLGNKYESLFNSGVNVIPSLLDFNNSVAEAIGEKLGDETGKELAGRIYSNISQKDVFSSAAKYVNIGLEKSISVFREDGESFASEARNSVEYATKFIQEIAPKIRERISLGETVDFSEYISEEQLESLGLSLALSKAPIQGGRQYKSQEEVRSLFEEQRNQIILAYIKSAEESGASSSEDLLDLYRTLPIGEKVSKQEAGRILKEIEIQNYEFIKICKSEWSREIPAYADYSLEEFTKIYMDASDKRMSSERRNKITNHVQYITKERIAELEKDPVSFWKNALKNFDSSNVTSTEKAIYNEYKSTSYIMPDEALRELKSFALFDFPILLAACELSGPIAGAASSAVKATALGSKFSLLPATAEVIASSVAINSAMNVAYNQPFNFDSSAGPTFQAEVLNTAVYFTGLRISGKYINKLFNHSYLLEVGGNQYAFLAPTKFATGLAKATEAAKIPWAYVPIQEGLSLGLQVTAAAGMSAGMDIATYKTYERLGQPLSPIESYSELYENHFLSTLKYFSAFKIAGLYQSIPYYKQAHKNAFNPDFKTKNDARLGRAEFLLQNPEYIDSPKNLEMALDFLKGNPRIKEILSSATKGLGPVDIILPSNAELKTLTPSQIRSLATKLNEGYKAYQALKYWIPTPSSSASSDIVHKHELTIYSYDETHATHTQVNVPAKIVTYQFPGIKN